MTLRQPFLHDLAVVLRAPTQVWSAPNGDVDGSGVQGAFFGDHRVLRGLGVDVQEQRRLAFGHRFHGGFLEPRRQVGQFLGELQQQRQFVLTVDVGEVGDHLGQRGRYGHGAAPGSSPATMGTRTVLPHSVHEPS